MSVSTYRRIWCDGPGSGSLCGSSFGLDMPGETAAELRRRAREEAGWIRTKEQDLCADCQQTKAGAS